MTIYYVSNTGSNGAAGTSRSTAWADLTKVNATTFSAGDFILFERGGEWEGTITVGSSGSSGSPITYGAYGTGARPKFRGTQTLSTWTVDTGSIYTATCTTQIYQLFIDDVLIQNARIPKTGYYYIDTDVSTVSFTCTDLDSGIDYTDAVAHIRTAQWRLPSRAVASSSSQTITLVSEPTYGFDVDDAFFLNNHYDFLTQAGEWYYDPTGDDAYLWTPNSDDPDNYTIRVTNTSAMSGVDIAGYDYITFKGLHFTQYSGSGINGITTGSDYITIDDCKFSYIDGCAVEMKSTTYFTFKNSIMTRCQSGVLIQNEGISWAGLDINIDNNIAYDMMVFEDLGQQGAGNVPTGGYGAVNNAFFTRTKNVEWTNNKLFNIGYIGLQFYGQYTNAQYNYINGACKTLNDGGGIYTWVGQSGGTPNSTNSKYSTIQDNVIVAVNNQGTGYNESYATTFSNFCVYLDEASEEVSITNNVIDSGNASVGIFYHYTINCDSSNNMIYDSVGGLYGSQLSGMSTLNEMTYNTVCNKEDTIAWYLGSPISAQLGRTNALVGDLSYDYNTYIDRHHATPFREGDGSYTFLDFTDWKLYISDDANSTMITTSLSANETEVFVYNSTKVAKTYYLNNATSVYDNVSGTAVTADFVLQPFTGKLLRGINVECVAEFKDITPPTVTDFTIPSTSSSFTISVTTFTATDNQGVYQYLVTNSSTTPSLTDSNWSDTPQTEVYAYSNGVKTFYAWARDKAGNISAYASDSCTVTVTDVQLTTSLAAWYDFDETSGYLLDKSTNSNDAYSLGSNITINQSGHPGKSYLWEADSYTNRIYVYDDDTLSIATSTPMTVSMWVNLDSSKAHAVCTKTHEYMCFVNSSMHPYFRLYENDTTTSMSVYATDTLEVDTDYLLQFVCSDTTDRSTMKIYINGVEAAGYSTAGNSTITNVSNTTNTLQIGGEATIGYYLNGNLSQLVLHSKVLNSNEMIAMYNNGDGIYDYSYI